MQGPLQYGAGYKSGEWTTGLCGCTEDPSNCCITCCCPGISFGQNAEIIDKGNTSCVLATIIYVAIAYVGCACLYSYTFRTKLRALYSLPEDPCADFCVHCCCGYCAICQEYRELKNRGADPALGWTANEEKMNSDGSMMPPNVTEGMPR